MKKIALIALGILIGFLPLAAYAEADPSGSSADPSTPPNATALQRDGVFGCSQNGAYSMSVGALSATGGAYVPVNDAAVTLNTGYLVYKECVLRGVVDREREYATAALQHQIVTNYATGNNGQPYFSQNITIESRNKYFASVVNNLKKGALAGVNPAYRAAVTNAVAKGFANALNNPYSDFTCPYQGDLNAVLSGAPTGSYWDGMTAAMNPSCNPYYSYMLANAQVERNAQNDVSNMLTQLQWYGGTYPTYATDPDTGEDLVVTPGNITAANTIQALQTGFYQLQNANDIDQMVGNLFAGITSHIINDSRGLAGLVQKTGSNSSYLDQVVSTSANGLKTSGINAALQILTTWLQVESGYKNAEEAIAQVFIQTIADIQAKENACWNLIIQKECATPLKSDNTCTASAGSCTTDPSTGQQTCPTGETLKVATSTAHSKALIDAKIMPAASSTAQNIKTAASALTLIQQLLKDVTNASAPESQSVALAKLDQLVSSKAIFTQYDLQNAQQQKDSIGGAMAQIITDAVTGWGDSTDVSTGWCNVNNAALVSYWKDQWRVNK